MTTAKEESQQQANIKCNRHILGICKLVWEFRAVLCLLDTINECGTLGPSCTWLERSTVGTAVQYRTHAMDVFIIQKLRSA